MRLSTSLRYLSASAILALGAPAARAQVADACFQCGTIYSVDGSGFLYAIDVAAGTSTPMGFAGGYLDIAATSSGHLYGFSGVMTQIETCTLANFPTGVFAGGNGAAGDLSTSDIFIQGPPLERTPETGPAVAIGGMIGGAPPDWCGGSSGDLAMNPADGLLYSSVWGCGCGGD